MTTYGTAQYGAGVYGDATAVSTLNLHEDKSKRTATTVTLVWNKQGGISGYLFKKNGKIVSQSVNPDQTTVKVSAKPGDKLEVIPTVNGEALTIK